MDNTRPAASLDGQRNVGSAATPQEQDHTLSGTPLAAADAVSTPGRWLGRYRLERLLGEGGFGRVFLAHDEALQREVVIKLPRRQAACPPDDDPFLAEARIVASLEHPHIVSVYDVGRTAEGQYYVVSRFVEGTTLTARMGQRCMPADTAAALVATVAEALHYAHRHGVVHRDIKPANILLDASQTPHLADFGLALRDADFGRDYGYLGTPAYMSPEQASGDSHRVDGRSDIFSLGVVLYELLVGRRPFQAKSAPDLLDQICKIDPKPPRQIEDAIPADLERIVLKMLAKRPADRYTTAKDVAHDLRQYLARRDDSRNRRRMLVPSLVAGTMIVAVTVAIFLLATRPRNEKPPGSPPPNSVVPAPGTQATPGLQPERPPVASPSPSPPQVAAHFPPQPASEPPHTMPAMSDVRAKPELASGRPAPSLTLLHQLRGHTGPVRCLAFSADGRMLASGADDSTLQLWDASTGEKRDTLRGYPGAVQCASFSADGRWLAWSGDGFLDMQVELWSTVRRERRSLTWSEPNSPSRVHGLAFSADGQLLAAAGSGPVRIWDVTTGQPRRVLAWQQTFPSYAYAVSFSADGRWLAAGCHGGGSMSQPDTVRLWEMAAENEGELLIGSSTSFGLSHEDVRAALAISPDGKTVARVTRAQTSPFAGPAVGSLTRWQLDESKQRSTGRVPGGNAFALCFLDKGRLLAAAAQGAPAVAAAFGAVAPPQPSVVQVWDSAREESQELETSHEGPVLAVAFSANGMMLATGSEDNTVRIWSLDALNHDR